MYKNILKFAFPAVCLLFLFNSCSDKCYYYEEVTVYEEILADASDVKNSFGVVNDFAIKKPGNIYTYNSYLFVAEKNEGIHILNNSNPASPIPLKFIKLKGNSNFAVAGDVLLADNGADLLSINFSDLENIKIDKRTENINPDIVRADNKVVAGYNETKVKKKMSCDNNDRFMMNAAEANPGSVAHAGKGGSMARFAVVGNFLYVTHSAVLLPVEITNPSNPVKKLAISFSNRNVETIFPYKDYLYFGTTSGVLVYDCAASPETPVYRKTLTHALGCDPVVVSEDICFSTVRNNIVCRGGNTINAMFIYNVSNINSPLYLRNIPMENPYGLGVKGNLIFVCQGDKGLSVYDWDPTSTMVTLKHNYEDIHAYDVIVNGNTLIVTAENGLFQFDCSNPDNIKYLATLSTF